VRNARIACTRTPSGGLPPGNLRPSGPRFFFFLGGIARDLIEPGDFLPALLGCFSITTTSTSRDPGLQRLDELGQRGQAGPLVFFITLVTGAGARPHRNAGYAVVSNCRSRATHSDFCYHGCALACILRIPLMNLPFGIQGLCGRGPPMLAGSGWTRVLAVVAWGRWWRAGVAPGGLCRCGLLVGRAAACALEWTRFAPDTHQAGMSRMQEIPAPRSETVPAPLRRFGLDT